MAYEYYDPLKEFPQNQGQMAEWKKKHHFDTGQWWKGKKETTEVLPTEPLSGGETPKDIYGDLPTYAKSAEEIEAEEAMFSAFGEGIKKDPTTGKTIFTPPSQSDIYKSTLDMFQEQIDALDRAYADKKAELTQQLGVKSEREIGTQRALLGGAGMLGQVSGAGQKAELEEKQEARLKTGLGGLESELEMRKSNLFGEVRSMAQSDYQSKMQAYSGGINTLLKYLEGETTQKETHISDLVKNAILNDIPLDDPNDDWVTKYAEELGVQPQQITTAYTEAKTSYEAEQAEAEAKALKEEIALAKTEAETEAIKWKMENPSVNSVIDKSTGRVLLIDKDTGNVIRDFGAIKEKPEKPIEEAEILRKLEESKGGGYGEYEQGGLGYSGFVEPSKYADLDTYSELRRITKMSPAKFDERYKTMLSPEDQKGFEEKEEVEEEEETALTREWFVENMSQEELEKEARKHEGKWFGKGDTEAYLDYLEGVIKRYKDVGWSDEKILEEMQK